MKRNVILRMILAAMFVAIGVVVPAMFHINGQVFLPLHIPVMLAGLICGPAFGFAAGLITPIVLSLTTGMPALYPMAFCMALECAAYGLVCGLLVSRFGGRRSGGGFVLYTLLVLIAAMLTGRVVYALGSIAFGTLKLSSGALAPFISGLTVKALPGIVIQLVLVPSILFALRSAGLFPLRGGKR